MTDVVKVDHSSQRYFLHNNDMNLFRKKNSVFSVGMMIVLSIFCLSAKPRPVSAFIPLGTKSMITPEHYSSIFLRNKSTKISCFHRESTTFLAATKDSEASSTDSEINIDDETTQVLELELTEHKPLGCTVEESLASEPDNSKKPIFVSKIVEGGNAEKAGLKVGDLLLEVSGVFTDVMEDVTSCGLQRVKNLVSGYDPENTLVIKVQRGTDVLTRHEQALVDLCLISDSDVDVELDDCLKIINSGEEISSPNDDDKEQLCIEDGEEECMLDTMFSSWSEDFTYGNGNSAKNDSKDGEEEEEKSSSPPPWASRSSPSGTYVRDPRTGEMRNIN